MMIFSIGHPVLTPLENSVQYSGMLKQWEPNAADNGASATSLPSSETGNYNTFIYFFRLLENWIVLSY